MNPAVNPKLAVSSMFGEGVYRDVEASALAGSEANHGADDSLYQPHSNALEDSVRQDNRLAVHCSQISGDNFNSIISLAGVEHMVLLGKDGKGVFAVSAFNDPVYLGETLDEVRDSISALRRATNFKQRGYLA
ncbi:MAG: hypothetical protein ABH840_01800 [Nanoarchaeota archaeon]